MASLNDRNMSRDSSHIDSPLLYSNFGEGFHVLVTGGQGYIGSHTVLRMLEEGFMVTVVDSGVNSNPESMVRVRSMVTPMQAGNLFVHNLDLCDAIALKATLKAISQTKKIDACVHFAGLKAVGESTKMPLRYHQNNVTGTLNLLQALETHGCRNLIFSSSATVYGSAVSPINESSTVGVGITNPYGRSKFFIEQILEDLATSPEGKIWGLVTLRYFNPVGAHPSGKIGEDPNGPPNNLMPFVAQVAVGRREFVTIFGDDYDTPDGTGVRDYIHVMDLAEGHLAALKKLQMQPRGHSVYNLGTGSGISVKEMVSAMEKASGLKIPVKVGKRRPGDVASSYANVSKAEKELMWVARLGVDRMCKDLWRWQNMNPAGYNKPDKEFGAFKPVAFSKANMPKLSSEDRPKTSKKPPKDRGQPKAFTDAMRGRGSSMDDVTGDSSSEANAGASSESATGGAAAAVEDEY